MAAPGHRPVARARRFLLAFMALLVAALVGLYLFGRAGRDGVPLNRDPEGPQESPRGEITLVGEDFEFTHSEGEHQVFRIRGQSVRADRAGTVYLDGVGLTLYDEKGAGYEISGTSASFNRETRQADLEGEVELRGPDNASLAAAGLKLVDRGQVLESEGPVRFTYLQLTGRADRMRVDRNRDAYVLAGAVHVETLPGAEQPASLDATRVVFERGQHLLRAEGDVVLARGNDRVQAALINAYLDDANQSFLFLRARWQVSGRLRLDTSDAPGGDRVLRFRGRSLAVLRDLGGLPQTAELEGAPRFPAVIESPSPARTVQRIAAGYLLADFTNGTISTVRAFNAPSLVEVERPAQGGAELRRLDGKRMEAGFAADGRMVRLSADEEIHFRDAELSAEGDRVVYDVVADKGEFFGQPVKAVSERGELLAPKVVYERDARVISAQGGVRALAESADEVGLGGTPLASGEGPVRVESKEAFWRDQPRSALFRGDVRAWRGENLLLAQAVRGDETEGGQRLVASGSVRTVWVPTAPDAKPGAARPSAAADGPVEVTANTLSYQRSDDLLVYEGRVRAEQADRDLACKRLEIALDDDGKAERLTCIEDVVLDDRRAGNSARGARAVYDLSSRTVTMLGDPVTLKKNDGAQVQGKRVVYDLETGTARVLAEPRPAEAPADEAAAASPEGG